MKKKITKNPEAYREGYIHAKGHHLLGIILEQVSLLDSDMSIKEVDFNKLSFARLIIQNDTEAMLTVNKYKKMTAQTWEFVYLTVATILGLALYKKLSSNKQMYLAVHLFAIHYVRNIVGNEFIPEDWKDFYLIENEISFKNEISIYEQLVDSPSLFQKYSHINLLSGDILESIKIQTKSKKYHTAYFGNYKKEFNEIFGDNLVEQAQKTIQLSGNRNKVQTEDEKKKENLESSKAKKWFMNHYPLLAGIVSQFDIVEDIKECQRFDIKIAAVSALDKIIYINPLAQLNEKGMRFVMAHEILHVALNHSSRCGDRDKLTWNLACDFVINHWLVEMGIGVPPETVYSDDALKGKSADEIYLLINQDNRIKKKLGTLKNTEAGTAKKNTDSYCDMLDGNPKYFSDFEDACKEALLRGVFLHEITGRGLLPADFVEEVKLINQPAIPWQAELADWIAEKFPSLENKRTYARPSRRQSSTPDIPRASYIKPDVDKMTRTYGVIIDTSGSVDRELLAKCIGAIVSYSQAQDVKFVRLVFCDARPYDEGYVPIDMLLNKVTVKGRGGTVLQPAVNMLEHASDFPKDAPILILTDGYVEDDLTIQREHAFLVPNKLYLPFIAKGKVFEFEKN